MKQWYIGILKKTPGYPVSYVTTKFVYTDNPESPEHKEEFKKMYGPFKDKAEAVSFNVRNKWYDVGIVQKNPILETAGAVTLGIVGGEVGKHFLKKSRILKNQSSGDIVYIKPGSRIQEVKKGKPGVWKRTTAERSIEAKVLNQEYGIFTVRIEGNIYKVDYKDIKQKNPRGEAVLIDGAYIKGSTYQIRLMYGKFYLYKDGKYTGKWFTKEIDAKRFLNKQKNPGERWHEEKAVVADAHRLRALSARDIREAEYQSGKLEAHTQSAEESRRREMKNPYSHHSSASTGNLMRIVRGLSKQGWPVGAIIKELSYQFRIPERTATGIVRSALGNGIFRRKNPFQIPERVLVWREKLHKGTIMRPKTFRKIQRGAKRRGYESPTGAGGKAYWITLLRKYLNAHPGDKQVTLLLKKFARSRYKRAANPFLETSLAVAIGITGGEIGKHLLRKSKIISRNPRESMLNIVREKLHPDSLSLRHGIFTARWGFFYTHGRSAEKYAAEIKQLFPEAIIIDTGMKWTAFSGGASVDKQSHFWVKFKLGENPKRRKELDVFEKHQLKIARDTLKMTPAMARVMGGMTVEEAEEFIASMKREGKANPPKGAVKIYDDIEAIEAVKGKDSHFPNERFRHDFKSSKGKASIFGLPDGSLLVKGNKKLWKRFDYA